MICLFAQQKTLLTPFLYTLKPLTFEILEGDVGCLCSSVVRAVDRQSKDLGLNLSTVKSVFFTQKDFKFFKFEFNLHLFAI